jgi:hypothetical protein
MVFPEPKLFDFEITPESSPNIEYFVQIDIIKCFGFRCTNFVSKYSTLSFLETLSVNDARMNEFRDLFIKLSDMLEFRDKFTLNIF